VDGIQNEITGMLSVILGGAIGLVVGSILERRLDFRFGDVFVGIFASMMSWGISTSRWVGLEVASNSVLDRRWQSWLSMFLWNHPVASAVLATTICVLLWCGTRLLVRRLRRSSSHPE
jgi:hypothetical protein